MSKDIYPGMNYKMGTILEYSEFVADKILKAESKEAIDKQIKEYIDKYGSVIIQNVSMKFID